MKLLPAASRETLAVTAAELFAERIRECVADRGRCLFAVSGGTEPWAAFRHLATFDLPWSGLHVLQVDERAVPPGHAERNWKHLEENWLDRVPIPPDQLHPMPVEAVPLIEGARRYAALLASIAGTPPVLDLVHLGLGGDGHTASLVPGDPVLEATDVDVAVTAPYRGWPRMTLTYPAIDRARVIVWLVGGQGKTEALRKLLAGDMSIPAARVRRDNAVLVATQADLSAAGAS